MLRLLLRHVSVSAVRQGENQIILVSLNAVSVVLAMIRKAIIPIYLNAILGS